MTFLDLERVTSIGYLSKVEIRFDDKVIIDESLFLHMTYKLVSNDQDVTGNTKFYPFLIEASNGIDLYFYSTDYFYNYILFIGLTDGYKDTDGVKPSDPNKNLRTVFPIKTEGLSNFNSKFTKSIFDSLNSSSAAMANTRPAATALLISKGSYGSLLDKLFCDLSYLNLVTPRNLTYSVSILYLTQNVKQYPFIEKNPFEDWAHEKNCPRNLFFRMNSIECGFFMNYGYDLSFKLGLLAFNIALTIVESLARKKIKRIIKTCKKRHHDLQASALRYMHHLLVSLTIKHIFARMDGNVLDIMFFSIVNLYNFKEYSVPMILGFILSVAFIIYYIFYCYMLWKFGRQLTEKLATVAVEAEKQEREIQDLVKFKTLRYSIVSPVFEGIRFPLSHPVNLYYPLLTTARYMMIGLVLSTASRAYWNMPILCALIEFSYYVYNVWHKIKVSELENRVEQFNLFMHTLYNLLAVVGFTSISEDHIENIDIAMMCILITVIVVNGLIVLLTVILIVLRPLTGILRKCRSRRRQLNVVHFADVKERAKSNQELHTTTLVNRKKTQEILQCPKDSPGFEIVEEPVFQPSKQNKQISKILLNYPQQKKTTNLLHASFRQKVMSRAVHWSLHYKSVSIKALKKLPQTKKQPFKVP